MNNKNKPNKQKTKQNELRKNGLQIQTENFQ